ncbi:MAG: DUF1565 domain-containing protein, partial [Planctomycetota bacterium]
MKPSKHQICVIGVSLIMGILLVGGECLSAEYWVAITGDDSAAGSKTEPFRTIQRGVNALKGGDALFVRAGR